jgi:hypothetical protein
MTNESVPKCPACGGSVLEPGTLGIGKATGPVFSPQRATYQVTGDASAVACLDCGHISLWLRSFDRSGLREARDAGRLKPR